MHWADAAQCIGHCGYPYLPPCFHTSLLNYYQMIMKGLEDADEGKWRRCAENGTGKFTELWS